MLLNMNQLWSHFVKVHFDAVSLLQNETSFFIYKSTLLKLNNLLQENSCKSTNSSIFHSTQGIYFRSNSSSMGCNNLSHADEM